ncbi:LysM peptidoglycan-binding domain-containing protein [Paenibacillus sp. TRM 82003]|uniref:LysM peptidoglycan-binding domain-containing protein n=1 Tax=Kineococcus sp. TRM81007 TaxID=2925831 RepID=UPI001F5A4D76|nr:LysM peptidoglycan-binding domain-containing protein [Kineococcus sp. TRM81007]MCI2237897.1 LysM peptidoglycan-binding domain-containing protein [Kineococcus sp. TRM81007]MCI3924627.1 LysM peptidoglycan-binding domain-containing protein [Paenibacillus sp. TRM 82003]
MQRSTTGGLLRPGPSQGARAQALATLAVGAALAVLPAGAAWGLVALSAPALDAALNGTASLADLLTGLCGAVAGLLLAALAGSVLLAAGAEARERSHRPGRRSPALAPTASRAVPAPVRRVVALAVGLALGTGAASAASAAPRALDAGWAAAAPQVPGHAVDSGDTHVVTDPGWAPLPPPRTVAAVPAADLPGNARPAPAGDEVVVQRGDSLWSLARSLTGTDASPGDVLREQQRLYAANADVIGSDPDVLLPGQVLRLP